MSLTEKKPYFLMLCSGGYSHDAGTIGDRNKATRYFNRLFLEGKTIMQVKLTATYFLTTDHPKGKYDQPVLINRATGQAFMPYDAFVAYESWPVMSAAQVLSKMASWRDFSVEERRLIEQFLGIEHQDELPMSKVREGSGTSHSVSSRRLSESDHLAFTRQRKREPGSL